MEEQNKPALTAVGFKEWSSVCAAIGAGRQRLIVRKGGIAEGRTGFSFKHQGFFLFPTLFHEEFASVREVFEDVDIPVAEESIPIRYFAELLWTGELADWNAVRELETLHIWKETVIRERFLYGDEAGKGSVQVAVVRPWDLGETWWIPYHRSYGGCRSWVDLPEIPREISDKSLREIENRGGQEGLVDVLGKIGVTVSV